MNSQSHFPKTGEEIAKQSVAVQVATMAVGGATVTNIAKQLQMTRPQIKRILGSDECIAAMQSITREALATAKARIRIGVADLADMVVEVIKSHLEKNNLHAIAPALKVLGIVEEEPEKAKDTNITVVLPGARKPETIDITPKG